MAQAYSGRQLRIVQISPASFTRDGIIGGGERISLYINRALHRTAEKAGVPLATTILTLDGKESFGSETDRFQGVAGKVWQATSVDAAQLVSRLRNADIVYVHQCLTEIGLFAAAHARLLGKPVYGSDAGAGEAAMLQPNPEAAIVFSALHAISEFAAMSYAGLAAPVHIIPGPVDTDAYVPSRDVEVKPSRTFVSLGRVLPHKGLEHTIRALPRHARLHIIGQHYDDDYLSFLHGCAAGKDVVFSDDLDDAAVKAEVENSAALVHASTHVDYNGKFYYKPELLGLAPLEALSLGVPTIVSNAGSLPELGSLPGCTVFRTQDELSSLMASVIADPPVALSRMDMHTAVVKKYGLLRVGTDLLKMMKVLH